MIQSIHQKEWVHTLRDRRFIIMSAIVFFLLLSATLIGWQSYSNLQHIRHTTQHEVNEQWKNQPARHPHRVSHAGYFVFRPKSSLSFLDFGVDSFTGVSLFLEAHRQNNVNFSQAQQLGSFVRFGEMTVAFVLQLLIPLIIIFLCFEAFTKEKETGTLKMLLIQSQISLKKIAIEKIKGYCKIVSYIVFPSLLISLIGILIMSDFELTAQNLIRIGLFFGFYTLYFFSCIVVVVWLSAYSQNSRSALVKCLGLWIITCIILPKAFYALGENNYTQPTKAMMETDVMEETHKVIIGHNLQGDRGETIKKELLKKYNVNSLEELPVNLDGILMAKGEELSSEIFQEHYAHLHNIFKKQNAIGYWGSFINPYLALKYLSMSIAGSDMFHFLHFQKAAEDYRMDLILKLNKIQTEQLKLGDKTTRLDPKIWSTFAPFQYKEPSIIMGLKNVVLAIFALLFWSLVIPYLAVKSIGNSKILNK